MFSVRPRFSMRRLAAASAFSAIALMLTVHPAAAQTTVIGFAPGFSGGETSASLNLATSAYNETASYNLGYTFSVSAPAIVTQLGFFADPYYYDPNNPHYSDQTASKNGTEAYAQSHDVGIYNAAGTLLTFATVTQADPLTDFFRYAALSPASDLVLLPGQTYTVAGVTGADDPFFEDVQTTNASGNLQSGITPAPGFTYGGSVSAVGVSLADNGFQSSSQSDPGLFGPNFRFSPVIASAAPEPGQWSVLALAALGLGTLIVRVRRRQAAH